MACVVTTICHTLFCPRRRQGSTHIYILVSTLMGPLAYICTGKCSNLRKQEWKERLVTALGFAENVFLLLQVLRKLSCLCELADSSGFLSYWIEISIWIYWQPFRFSLTSFKAFSRPRNWLTVGNKFLSSHAKHPPTLHSHFSAVLLNLLLTDWSSLLLLPPATW